LLTDMRGTTDVQLKMLQVAASEVETQKPGKTVYEKRCAVFFLADRDGVRNNVQGEARKTNLDRTAGRSGKRRCGR